MTKREYARRKNPLVGPRSQLSKLEFSFRGRSGACSTRLNDIGFVTAPDMRYACEVCSVWPSGFSARATANLDTDAHAGVWVVDNTGALHHVGID